MPYQAPDGIWWSDDHRSYLVDDKSIPVQESCKPQEPPPAPQQEEAPALTPADVENQAAALRALAETLSQSSGIPIPNEPYRQNNLVVGSNRPTPGQPVNPWFDVHPTIREAAKENTFLRAYVMSSDSFKNGGVLPDEAEYTKPGRSGLL